MDAVHSILKDAPTLAIFLTVAVGFFIGRLTIGQFVLGGIAGTLLAGVAIGQIGIDVDPALKNIFFALFIYAVGYQGGPQFFHALNLRTLNQLASAFVMCLTGLLCVLAAAWLFGLDRGTAAGLAAGGLTQSAIIGTAGDAIARLDLPAETIKVMQTNVAVGYAVCYIFGSLGPIIVVTWLIPQIMKWDIRQEAVSLAKTLSGGRADLEPGQFHAVRSVTTRLYRVDAAREAAGLSALALDARLDDAAVEALIRDGDGVPVGDETVLAAGDIVAITGRFDPLFAAHALIGPEVAAPQGFDLVEEERDVVLTNRMLHRRTVREIHDEANIETRHGVFIVSANRMGRELTVYPGLRLHTGDELRLVGRPSDLDRVQKGFGYSITRAPVTDFIFFGIGMAVGMLIGLIQFKIAGIPVTIGTGGGCLLSGLLFGWLRSVHPRFGALPIGASNYLRDFGLAVFVGVVGLTAGPQALKTLQEYGLLLFFLGVAVTLIPTITVFFFSYYVLRIKNPIEALGCVAGGRSANPAFAALLDKAGNSTPVVTFTVTYAVANVFLTLWGPVIVGLVTTNPASP